LLAVLRHLSDRSGIVEPMLSAKWTSSGAVAAALSAFLVFGSGAALTVAAQDAGPVSQLSARESYLVLEHRAADQMTADDAGILRARQKDLTFEAAMFGYDLTTGHWTYDQTICPDIPQALVLHYRITGRNGFQSLFTAVVPRDGGRVLVNPILYHGATPFQSATGQKRTLSVFNQAVPADIAKEAIQPNGHWLTLAMCFAEIAGAEPREPRDADSSPTMAKAVVPTLHYSSAHGAQEIEFAGREAPGEYTVWTITLNAAGRATAADAETYSDIQPRVETAAAAPIKEVPAPAAAQEPVPAATAEPATAPQPAFAVAPETPPAPPSTGVPTATPAPAEAVAPAASAETPAPAAAAPATVPVPAAASESETTVVEPVKGQKAPKVKKLKPMIEPKVVVIPDPPDPTEKVVPQ
jgi:hypothetical protein